MKSIVLLSIGALAILGTAQAETKQTSTVYAVEQRSRLPQINVGDISDFDTFDQKMCELYIYYFRLKMSDRRECFIAQINLDRQMDTRIRKNTSWYPYNQSFWEKWKKGFGDSEESSIALKKLRSSTQYQTLYRLPEFQLYLMSINDTQVLYARILEELRNEFQSKMRLAQLQLQENRNKKALTSR